MKRFSRKGVLLLSGAMAVCAFAVPSMASGASWTPVGQHDMFTSTGFGFTTAGLIANCSNASLTTRVDSAQVLTITTGSFSGCTAFVGPGVHCGMSWTPTRFPWRATARITTDIQIHDVLIDSTFSSCPVAQSFTLTGTLTGGSWTGNAAAQRSVVFTNAEGLTSHANGAATPLTMRGGFRGVSTQVLD